MPVSIPAPKKAQSPKTASTPAPQTTRSVPQTTRSVLRKVKTKPLAVPRLIFKDFASI